MQSLGVGKGREWWLCCAPQMEVQALPRASVEGHSWVMDTPAATPASDQGPCVCLLHQGLCLCCCVQSIWLLCALFQGNNSAGACQRFGLSCVSPKHVLAVPETPTAILSLHRAPQTSRLAALHSWSSWLSQQMGSYKPFGWSRNQLNLC